MNDDLLYQIALTQVPHIGPVHAKALTGLYGSAKAVFDAPRRQLENIEGIGSVRMQSLKSFRDFKSCELEIAFIERYKITPLFITDVKYPRRLLNCYDSPVLLYYRGKTDLNAANIVSIVGTRNHSEYGKHICEKFIEDLKEQQVLVVSGLAFGIDTIAHKAALKNALPTVGVLAHGLDRIYPVLNKSLAKRMAEEGGLLTEFKSDTNPDRENFPKRNRIVAGICDALVVVESGKKGGSLITAELANSYNRDVFALPGRTTDAKSEGCNYLIKNNKSVLVTAADDLLEFMNWKPVARPLKPVQRELFITLTPEEKILIDLLQQQEQTSIDELSLNANLSSSAIAAALLALELQGLIVCLPGKRYKMVL
jgi:DNA processing protein